MDLETFLCHHGVSRADVVAAIEERIGPQPDAILFLAGSVVEGLANPRSDLDAILVTDRPLAGLRAGAPLAIRTSPFALDVEWWPRSRVEAILDDLGAYPADRERNLRSVESFESSELRLLHRLRCGLPLRGEANLHQLRERVGTDVLARVLVDRAALEVDAQQTDVAGFVEEGDLCSALLQSAEMVGSTADALLAARGDTNLGRKWRLARLRRLEGVDLGLPGGPLATTPAEFFFQLWTVSPDTPARVRRHLSECVRLVNRVLPWARRRFLLPSESESRSEPRPAVAPGSDPILPFQGLDLRARWHDGHATLDCPDWRRPIVADGSLLDALACCDGVTRLSTAAERLAALTGAPRQEAEDRLATLVRRLSEGVRQTQLRDD